MSTSLTHNLITEVERVLNSCEEWTFDSFRLCEATDNQPLSTLAYFLFKKMDLINIFDIKESKLIAFLKRIELGYPDNPYHNRTHAADVL